MRYRSGARKLQKAVDDWTEQREKLSFVLNLGDIIDGNLTPETTLEDFEVVLKQLHRLRGVVPTHHVIGNHCLRLPSRVLIERLEMPDVYYSIDVHPKWKLVVVNSNDIGERAEGEEQKKETEAFLKKFPADAHSQIRPWNGGIGRRQLQWLRHELAKAKQSMQSVIVACHHPVGASSGRDTHMAWNADEIQSLLLDSGVVSLVLSGHDHMGGYSYIQSTHFLTLQGAIEAEDEMEAHGVIHITDEEIVIEGRGAVLSHRLPLHSR